jgi:hypothetical protein
MTPSNRDAVQFTRESAERIAGVVRSVELATPKGKPLSFEAVQSPPSQAKPFRIGTFTAAWAIGTQQVVTFENQTTTPNTVAAFNQLYDVAPLDTTQPQVCAIAKEGTAWYFVNTKDDGGGEVRKGSFTGAWGKGTTKTVQFTDGSTAAVTNSLYAIPSGSGSRDCIVAKIGDAWQLANESHSCVTGKDKESIASASEEIAENTQVFRLLLSRGSGDPCMKWVEVKPLTVITSIRFEDDGTGPILKCKMCKIWVPAFGLSGSTVPLDVGTGYVDVTIPVANCSVS